MDIIYSVYILGRIRNMFEKDCIRLTTKMADNDMPRLSEIMEDTINYMAALGSVSTNEEDKDEMKRIMRFLMMAIEMLEMIKLPSGKIIKYDEAEDVLIVYQGDDLDDI